jgi:hypothetical protein
MLSLGRLTTVTVFLVCISACVSTRMPGKRSLNSTEHGYTIVSDIVRAGEQSQRFEVRAGDCGQDVGWSDCANDRERSEFSLSKRFHPGKDQWIGFSIYLPADFVSSPHVNTSLGQIHQRGGPSGTAGGLPSFPPALQLNVKGQNYRACVHILSGSSDNVSDRCQYFGLAKLEQMRGKWTDVIVHFDTSAKSSLLEIFINGQRKAHLENFIKFWPHQYYVKYGIYRSFVSRHPGPMPTQVVHYDEVRMGRSQKFVIVRPDDPVD